MSTHERSKIPPLFKVAWKDLALLDFKWVLTRTTTVKPDCFSNITRNLISPNNALKDSILYNKLELIKATTAIVCYCIWNITFSLKWSCRTFSKESLRNKLLIPEFRWRGRNTVMQSTVEGGMSNILNKQLWGENWPKIKPQKPNHQQNFIPVLHCIEGVFTSDIIHEDEAHGSSVVGCSDGPVSFLSSCILGQKWIFRL